MTQPKPHGTYARFTAGCHCGPCRDAKNTYERDRYRKIGYGIWEPYVDAAPVRAHIETLRASGLGWRRIASLAGVSTYAVARLVNGDRRSKQPPRRMRRANAEAILAVRPSLDALADKVAVDATGTRRRLRALVAIGWTQAALSKRLGMSESNVWHIVRGRYERVAASTARAVRNLYELLWDTAPEQDTPHQRAACTRARRLAQKHTWAPPMAWDDEAIDDPRARPLGIRGLDSPKGLTVAEKRGAVAEATKAGLSAAEISRRTGISQRSVQRHRAALAREVAA